MAGKSSRSKSSSKRSSSRPTAAQRQEMARKQIWAIVLFAVGILFLFLSLIKGQDKNFWQILHNMLYGLFGWCGALLGPLLIYIAVMITMDKTIISVRATVIEAVVLLTLLCGITQVFGAGIPDIKGFWKSLSALYQQGVSLSGGGLLSGLVGIPLLALIGKWPSVIVIFLLIFVFVMLLTGTTLRQFFHKASQPVKKVGEVYTKKVASREPPKFNIDVPLDDDLEAFSDGERLPQHPVSSPKGSLTGAQKLMQINDKLLDPPTAQEEKQEPDKPAPEKKKKEPEKEKEHDGALDQIDDLISRMLNGDRSKERPAGSSSTSSESAANLLEIANTSKRREIPAQAVLKEIQAEQQIPIPVEREKTAEPIAKTSETPSRKSQEDKGETVAEEEIAREIQETAEEQKMPEEYIHPPVELLNQPKAPAEDDISEELKANAARLVDTLKSFGVQTRIVDISRGPAVTRYELQPSAGVKISRITSLADDIALNLAAAGVRIEAPIPGKAAVGIEVPNKVVSSVAIREVIDSQEFGDASSRLTVALGRDIAGNIALADLAKMPHLLIAGSTGSGKSVCINSFIVSLLFKSSPDEVKLLMVDPKVVELGIYNGVPHLLVPVVTDPRKAAGALNWAVTEMLHRYQSFAENSVRDLNGFNRLAASRDDLQPMPQIVIIIDELADLMMAAPNDVEDAICRLAQMARAAGMHLVIATQRPSVDVITGVIKANIPSRIAFAVSSQVDSRTILDSSGAEKLLGKGDMLFNPVGASKPVRVQGCFVSDAEVETVVEFIKNGGSAVYDNNIMEEIEKQAVAEKSKGGNSDGGGFDEEDDMLPAAIEVVVEAGMASTSFLQRRLKLGYARAARIMDDMEQKGIVSAADGSKPRQVLLSKERWMEMKLNQPE